MRDALDVYTGNANPELAAKITNPYQRKPIPGLNWVKTVLHGMLPNILTPAPVKQEYGAFLGRISPEKGADRAIEIAQRAGLKLKIAAKVDNADKEYYDSQIKPLLSQGHVEFIGEINDAQKPEFLGRATATLFAIDWPEPFGLVMIEAMSAGTPVIAFRNGSVPEVIKDGVGGVLCDNMDDAVAAVAKVKAMAAKHGRKLRYGIRAYAIVRETVEEALSNLREAAALYLETLTKTELRKLADKIGVASDPLKTGEFKDALNPFRPMTENERKLWENILDQSFQKFIKVIDDNREPLDADAVKALATGQIYTADDAKEKKLVDEIGYEEDALKALQAKLGLEKARVVYYRTETTVLEQLMSGSVQAKPAVDPWKMLVESTVPRAMYLCSWLPALPE